MKPYYSEHGIEIWHGDCREVLPTLVPCSIDACVTDPPYDLTSVSRNGSQRTNNPDNAYGRHKLQGFMGKQWDGTGVAFRPETWAAVLDMLKPGAYLLAFGATRTYHRMTCAIEDAGFVIKDCLMWCYGQGFPKSHNLDGEWSGWGTALKPAVEPIVLAQKPLQGTYAANVAAWGVGALNIDGCRLAVDPGGRDDARLGGRGEWHIERQQSEHTVSLPATSMSSSPLGRWPANLLLDELAAAELDRQSGALTSGTGAIKQATAAGWQGVALGKESRPVGTPNIEYGDTGGASRFFYVAKASRSEREQGLEHYGRHNVNDGRETSIDNPYQRGDTLRANTHPTVKPIQLMRYLVRLVTPPNGLVLDPFMGSGTTGIGCMDEGRRFVGVEQDEEYIAIAQSRVETAAARPYQPELFEVPA